MQVGWANCNISTKFSGQDVQVMYSYVHGLVQGSYTVNQIRSNEMSNYEMQIRATEQYYDNAIHAAEQENIEILSSVVPGSRLHQVIHNPVDSGIDEG